jgi:hypothetical protein
MAGLVPAIAFWNELMLIFVVSLILATFGTIGMFFGAIMCTIDESPKPGLIILGVSMIVTVCSVIAVVANIPQPIPCTVAPQSAVMWRSYVGGKYPQYKTYFQTPDQKFCLVQSRSLYSMGLGYKTNQSYQGEVIEQP